MSGSMEDFMNSIHRRISKSSSQDDEAPLPGPWNQPPLMKRMEDAACSARINGHCGETMEIYLQVERERITDASFFTDGCRFSAICGSLAAQMARGRSLEQAALIDGDAILTVLDGIPKSESHCAYLAAEALQSAIHNWMLQWRQSISQKE